MLYAVWGWLAGYWCVKCSGMVGIGVLHVSRDGWLWCATCFRRVGYRYDVLRVLGWLVMGVLRVLGWLVMGVLRVLGWLVMGVLRVLGCLVVGVLRVLG